MPNARLQRGSWLVTLALAGGGLLYLFCSFLPIARSIHALREETRARQQFGADVPLLTATTLSLQRQLEATKRFIADSRHRLPDATKFPELGSRMTRQTDLAGARTTHFEPQAAKDLASLRIVPVAFNAQGQYGQLCKLLAGLESLPERIWVDEMRIEPAREDSKDAQCMLKLTVFAGNSEKSD